MNDWLVPDRPVAIAPGFRLQWEQAQEAHVLLFPEGMVRLSESAGAILGRRVIGERGQCRLVDTGRSDQTNRVIICEIRHRNVVKRYHVPPRRASICRRTAIMAGMPPSTIA